MPGARSVVRRRRPELTTPPPRIAIPAHKESDDGEACLRAGLMPSGGRRSRAAGPEGGPAAARMSEVQEPPFYALGRSEVCAAVGTSPIGLTADEAQARLQRFGPNAIQTIRGNPCGGPRRRARRSGGGLRSAARPRLTRRDCPTRGARSAGPRGPRTNGLEPGVRSENAALLRGTCIDWRGRRGRASKWPS